MFFSLWFLIHFIASIHLFFNRKFYILFIFLFLSPLLTIYILKNPSYDLVYYYWMWQYSGNWYEPGYNLISNFFSTISFHIPKISHLFFQFFCLIIIFITAKNLFKNVELNPNKNSLIIFLSVTTIALLSIFFFLGSQNVVRQFLATLFIFYGYSLINQKKKKGILFYLIAITTHYGSIITVLLLMLNHITKKSISLNLLISFIASNLLVFLLLNIFQNYEMVKFYLNFSFMDDRSTYLKFLLITGSIFITTIIFFVSPEKKINQLRNLIFLKLSFTIFSLPLFYFSLFELYSRYIYAYYIIDMYLIIFIIFKNCSQLYRLMCIVILLSYGVAPNIKNILSS